MGVCGSKPPAVKHDVAGAPAQNGNLYSAPPPPFTPPQQTALQSVNVPSQAPEPVAAPAAEDSAPLQAVEAPSLSDKPILSQEPALPGIAIPADVVTPAKTPPLLSQAPAGMAPQGPAEMPYAAPFIPPPSLPPPESADPELLDSWHPGRRKAVLIGCNYPAIPQATLKGCVNDANLLRQLLMEHFGFQADAVIFLHDEQPHAEFLPTKANILAAIAWLVGNCQQSDSLFFSFSGHGCQPPHPEGGSWDEAILPCDFQQAGPLTDDEVHAAMIKPLRHGVRLHALIDACQSCPSLNLPCTARPRRDGWSEWQDGAHGHQRQRQVQLPAEILQQGGVAPMLQEPETASFVSAAGDAVLLTSTGDDDLIDAQASAQLPSTGPMAFSFVQAVRQNQAATYNVLSRAIRYALKNGPQHFVHNPQMFSSRRLDFNEEVRL